MKQESGDEAKSKGIRRAIKAALKGTTWEVRSDYQTDHIPHLEAKQRGASPAAAGATANHHRPTEDIDRDLKRALDERKKILAMRPPRKVRPFVS